MNNDQANCKDSKEAYKLAFSPALKDMNRMIQKYCSDCPVSSMCMIEAVRTDAYGVWGGTTREFRKELAFMKSYV